MREKLPAENKSVKTPPSKVRELSAPEAATLSPCCGEDPFQQHQATATDSKVHRGYTWRVDLFPIATVKNYHQHVA